VLAVARLADVRPAAERPQDRPYGDYDSGRFGWILGDFVLTAPVAVGDDSGSGTLRRRSPWTFLLADHVTETEISTILERLGLEPEPGSSSAELLEPPPPLKGTGL
jgi:hypothetical protein